ncbi:MAG: hypothetical protein A3H45_09055 [Ignavibacteria bacterium RIFCSPLOWO2_02_FULL_55_14]|nr:MAG: hypothetical protein A2X68_10040 [Ignavibacteria bacterium GWC2_56_12]OGU67217.1 MAG: hypothetical protein A3C56_05665 [Ignavibacteria bacterium RIFCSPHIGHO2_02_FULL_56_12]OGU69715.1 MAG: hypothetical protein A3H45_09055 [Ignavibacteria bacterium RIFCSPLOWO2_02_FULL_55_14]
MKNPQRQLVISQTGRKINEFRPLMSLHPPGRGWVHAVRTALGMSYRQFAQRLGMTPQSAKGLEEREADGSISLKSLRSAANALNMRVVYALVPEQEDLEAMIDRQARAKARQILLRTSHTMRLEDQGLSSKALERSEQELAAEIRRTMPRFLWD